MASGSSQIRNLGLQPGDVIEAALPNDDWGARVLFRVRALDDVDSAGQFCAAEFGGTNNEDMDQTLCDAFPLLTPAQRSRVGGDVASPNDGGDKPYTLLHFCSKPNSACRGKFGDLDVQHVEMIRRWDLNTGGPDWMADDFHKVVASDDEREEHRPGDLGQGSASLGDPKIRLVG